MSPNQVPFELLVKIDFFVETSSLKSKVIENHRGIIFPTPLWYFLGVPGSGGFSAPLAIQSKSKVTKPPHVIHRWKGNFVLFQNLEPDFL